MSFKPQFDWVVFRISHFRRSVSILVFALICLPASAGARQVQPVVGYIEGDSVSIASSASAISVPQSASGTAPVTNGGVVTLGPGQARLMLTLGGEIDVCGPAKFTLLQSGEAITVALEFGTLRLQLPESTTLRVFTPTIIATPVEINGTPGDVTLMLGQDDSLCVKPASGALLLESQFTNEKIVVPQSGQFWFEQGQLMPVARTDINCACLLPEARFVPSPAPLSGAVRAQITTAASPRAPAKLESESQADDSAVEYGVLAHPNDSHPVAERSKLSPAQAPELAPFDRVDMPPLSFSASSPVPPPASAEQMISLIRTTQIDPDFEFTGHVNPPPMDNRSAKNQSTKNASAPEPKDAGKKRGLWGRFKRFLVGSGSS